MQIVCYKTAFTIRCDTIQCASIKRETKLSATYDTKHERVSETGVVPSPDHVSGTLCLSHYVTEISHLYSSRDFWRHFGLCIGLRRIATVAFFAPCTNILTYLLTYLQKNKTAEQRGQWQY